MDVAISLTDARHLDRLWPEGRQMTAAEACAATGWHAAPVAGVADRIVGRLHFGNEFCETLVPRRPPSIGRLTGPSARACGYRC